MQRVCISMCRQLYSWTRCWAQWAVKICNCRSLTKHVNSLMKVMQGHSWAVQRVRTPFVSLQTENMSSGLQGQSEEAVSLLMSKQSLGVAITAELLCKLLFSGYVLAFPYRAHMQPNHVLLKVRTRCLFAACSLASSALQPWNLTVNHCCKLMTGQTVRWHETVRGIPPSTQLQTHLSAAAQHLSTVQTNENNYVRSKDSKRTLLWRFKDMLDQRSQHNRVPTDQRKNTNNWPSVTVSVFIFPQFLWEVKERRQLWLMKSEM